MIPIAGSAYTYTLRGPWVKLIAWIIGMGFDSGVRRQQHGSQRRILRATWWAHARFGSVGILPLRWDFLPRIPALGGLGRPLRAICFIPRACTSGSMSQHFSSFMILTVGGWCVGIRESAEANNIMVILQDLKPFLGLQSIAGRALRVNPGNWQSVCSARMVWRSLTGGSIIFFSPTSASIPSPPLRKEAKNPQGAIFPIGHHRHSCGLHPALYIAP